MLRILRLKNIVLVESAEIFFYPGLNVLSGETGSGKSAIMNALSLIAGERSDPNIIRHGAEKGVIEALFDISELPQLLPILEEAGIDVDNSELIIKREISITGKSRAFINNQMAQISLLRLIGKDLFEIVGQHANQKLRSLDNHRQILDIYGELQEDVAQFSKSWSEENALRSQLTTLLNTEAERLREIEVRRMEIEELSEANVKEGEEEEIFSEYSRLSSSEELAQKVNEIIDTFDGDPPILSLLSRQRLLFEQLQRIDPSLSDTTQTFENALVELQEVAHTLRNYASRIEFDPLKAEKINDRLTLINRLKRKYGQDLQHYLESSQKQLTLLENADNTIEDLRNKLSQIQEHNQNLSSKLTSQRDLAARGLEKAIKEELHSLNMPKAEFDIELSAQPRNRFGDDCIEFFLRPNFGEKHVSIKDCASGGETSRVLLALQTILAGKENMPTLVFDEIDANIGGETASIVGEKLKKIGINHQVLCITHFAQVATCAHVHLQISKQEIEGRTVTLIKNLEHSEREIELSRMQGRGQLSEAPEK